MSKYLNDMIKEDINKKRPDLDIIDVAKWEINIRSTQILNKTILSKEELKRIKEKYSLANYGVTWTKDI